ncbi:sulfurtransferase TusA family protein [Hazenella coriacea]|uniref:Rhodanese-related sulfurtransferase n=1 Tax=Hazenella coriacea TaxID=1179467 RepID=A0A4R3L4Q4_9BACL|nr:sulfurtransferase TusA family protein [Hazenella coriacea]TCS93968.1 rhodanese-related sulfurtransferase [Hazenella coriacea]
MSIKVDLQVDAKGLSCPMPIVRTKKAMDQLQAGQVLELLATDPGSYADIQGWAKSTGHHYLGTQQEGDVLKHYLRKANDVEGKEIKFPHTISPEELNAKLEKNEGVILDVREPAEYAFGHIPGAISIPYGELEKRMGELNPDEDIYVVCRTGNRSDLASQLLSEKGFKTVKNVTSGMEDWKGPIEKD